MNRISNEIFQDLLKNDVDLQIKVAEFKRQIVAQTTKDIQEKLLLDLEIIESNYRDHVRYKDYIMLFNLQRKIINDL